MTPKKGDLVTFSGVFVVNPPTYTTDCPECGTEFHSHHRYAIMQMIDRFADPKNGPFS